MYTHDQWAWFWQLATKAILSKLLFLLLRLVQYHPSIIHGNDYITIFLYSTPFTHSFYSSFRTTNSQERTHNVPFQVYTNPGGALPLLMVVGTCRWTGYDSLVINIDTGYLNRPNWLLAGCSVYHRVASQPTMFMTGPRSRHQRRCVRDATDFEFFISFYCKTIGQGISEVWVCIWKFLVRYIVTGCSFCAPSGLRQGQVLTPPAAPPTQLRGECPPPPRIPHGEAQIKISILHTMQTYSFKENSDSATKGMNAILKVIPFFLFLFFKSYFTNCILINEYFNRLDSSILQKYRPMT